MAPYDASEEVAPPFQSLYFSNVPWQVARYHQSPRDVIFEFEVSPKMVDQSVKSYPPGN